jgi:hypothetical protein
MGILVSRAIGSGLDVEMKDRSAGVSHWGLLWGKATSGSVRYKWKRWRLGEIYPLHRGHLALMSWQKVLGESPNSAPSH